MSLTTPAGLYSPPTGQRLDEVRIPHAAALQRSGLTLTEIAKRMGVPREAVVQALYWDVVEREEREK